MAEKNWTDKLRQKMSEYTETPPGGLWEGIESAAGLGGKAAAGGFWAWLTSRPALWPVWATAGVAAAAAALLLLRTPATEPASPGPDLPSTVIAQTETEEDTTVLDVDSIEPEASSTDSSTSVMPGEPAPAVLSGQPASTVMPGQPASTVMPGKPASTVMPGLTGHPSTAISSDPTAISNDPSAISSDSSVISSGGGARVEKSPDQPGSESAETIPTEQAQPDSGSNQPKTIPEWTPNTPGSTAVPISRLRKRSKPLFAASLVGSNAPGGGTTITSNGYGFATPTGNYASASAANPKMAMLGRNKSVQTDVSHRQDYQFGILLGYSFNDRWGVESGVTLTGLSSGTKETNGTFTRVKKESFTYIGVPLRVVFYPFRYNSLSLYTSAGPAVEYGLRSSWESYDIMGDQELNPKSDSARPGDWVFSASLNAGVQWQPWNYGAFFIQPGVVGRLVSENSPESFYTTHPVSFQLAAGYKFTF